MNMVSRRFHSMYAAPTRAIAARVASSSMPRFCSGALPRNMPNRPDDDDEEDVGAAAGASPSLTASNTGVPAVGAAGSGPTTAASAPSVSTRSLRSRSMPSAAASPWSASAIQPCVDNSTSMCCCIAISVERCVVSALDTSGGWGGVKRWRVGPYSCAAVM